ncbi:G patch domain-containing protein 1 homolog [Toxorhynchites rutilus septentrionalis]|uniref:G patch domain-containing protein 1 homolog n=1 Tax=Toxorhynchites rutilus septentrionalis TaxID=329112 RepID=UPI002478B70D|nr:G patch domain-containing protein 1 homolog [Toxorhynchites rutilus septentrionalis]
MDEDDETLCKYGTQLPPYEQDEIPSKKPVSVEDQIVLDVNGKRRFHGAFTGGFSAGYWNTVGSEEGWKPTEFKSSRQEKAKAKVQNPMDFMDDEDLGEFGIAPQRVQAKEDFAPASKATKRRMHTSGSAIAQPVLRALLEPAKEKTVVGMLKRMGWREGQGIGERQDKSEKKKAKERNKKERYVMRMYGCEHPDRTVSHASHDETDSESDLSDCEINFAPDDFDPLVAMIKDNVFGLGYKGLNRHDGESKRFNLFDTLEVVDKNNKKLSIRGQAFGIGALEEDDDEDIYAKDDMTRYDFSLGEKSKTVRAITHKDHEGCLEGFCPSKMKGKQNKKIFRVEVPATYVARNWMERRSRFEPIDETRRQHLKKDEYKLQGLGRHDLNPLTRGQILGEPSVEPSSSASILDSVSRQQENLVSAEIIDTSDASQSRPVAKISKDLKVVPNKPTLRQEASNYGSTSGGFKPFINYPDKQDRYEKFISFKPSDKFKNKEAYLGSLQPLGMSEWDREREQKEFIQAQRMYRPMDGLMSDRFVTESTLKAERDVENQSQSKEITMKRVRVMWKPQKELCKRFNVPEPFGGMMEDEKDKPKATFSVFDYLEVPVNSKTNFVTPVIIPRKSDKDVNTDKPSSPVRLAAQSVINREKELSTPPLKSQQSQIIIRPKTEKRTELEQQVIESVNKPTEEKKNLFKSIFCSSDEEDEGTDIPQSENNESSKLPDSEKAKLVDSLVAIKPASEVNILRNNSPPRGIFKSIFEIKSSRQASQDSMNVTDKILEAKSSSNTESDVQNDALYGPKLPASISNAAIRADKTVGSTIEVDKSKEDVEWVEKRKISGKSKKKHKEHKKSKKNKKDKKKHKHQRRER